MQEKRATSIRKPEQGDLGNLPTAAPHPTRSGRKAMGKGLREACPRDSHAEWKASAKRPDPVELLLTAYKGRHPELLSLRHGRMVQSPATFYRGSGPRHGGGPGGRPGDRHPRAMAVGLSEAIVTAHDHEARRKTLQIPPPARREGLVEVDEGKDDLPFRGGETPKIDQVAVSATKRSSTVSGPAASRRPSSAR